MEMSMSRCIIILSPILETDDQRAVITTEAMLYLSYNVSQAEDSKIVIRVFTKQL